MGENVEVIGTKQLNKKKIKSKKKKKKKKKTIHHTSRIRSYSLASYN